VGGNVAAWQIVLALFAAAVLAQVFSSWLRLRRAEFIRAYQWPPGLLERLEKHRPGLVRKDSALVSRGLRQFFIAYLMSGRRCVSMPPQVADDLWHEFILYTANPTGSAAARSAASCIIPRRSFSADSARVTKVFAACGGIAARTRA
jgi:hypothetical protein